MIAARFTWAVDTLAAAPADHLLEIGCGHGIALALISPGLTTGTITGIDRSATMIEAAAKRNEAAIKAGRVQLQPIAIQDADFAPAAFNKIFAINVNLTAQDLRQIKPLLAAEGRLYLFQQPPIASKIPLLADQFQARLAVNGFTIHATEIKEIAPVAGLCIIAT